jgi:hypothetical protein
MEEVKTACLVPTDQCLVICSPVPILDWTNMKGEALARTHSEPKVLQWKWFLSEFLSNHKIMAKGKMPLWVEEIASAPMVPCPITMPKITQAKNIGRWWTERLIMYGVKFNCLIPASSYNTHGVSEKSFIQHFLNEASKWYIVFQSYPGRETGIPSVGIALYVSFLHLGLWATKSTVCHLPFHGNRKKNEYRTP